MPPMNPRQQQRSQQMCPACGGDPQRGRKKNEPPCKVCHGGMSDSPLGKRAMAQASNVGAAKFKQAVQQRQRASLEQQMRQRAIAGGAPANMPPGVTDIGARMRGGLIQELQQKGDPRAAMIAQALAARMRGGR